MLEYVKQSSDPEDVSRCPPKIPRELLERTYRNLKPDVLEPDEGTIRAILAKTGSIRNLMNSTAAHAGMIHAETRLLQCSRGGWQTLKCVSRTCGKGPNPWPTFSSRVPPMP